MTRRRDPFADPHAEREYLAIVMLDATTLVREPVDPAWLTIPRHRTLLGAMLEAYEAGEVNTITLRPILMARGESDPAAELLELASGATLLSNAPSIRERLASLYRDRARASQIAAAHGAMQAGDVASASAIVDDLRRVDAAGPRALPWEWLAEWQGDPIRDAPPARSWLLRRPNEEDPEASAGVLPLGKCGMLAGAGSAGKSTALVQLALAVATGRPWLDTFSVPRPGNVLLALAEEDRDEVRRRIHYAARHMGLSEHESERARRAILPLALAGTPVALIENDGNGNVRETRWLAWLRDRLATTEWRLVILDPLARFACADAETDNGIATRFVQAVETLVSLPGSPTVLVAHHTTKAARKEAKAHQTDARGASAFTDGFRWQAHLTVDRDDKDRVSFSIEKSNYAPCGRPLELRRGEGGALRAVTPRELAEARAAATTNGRRKGARAEA